MRGKRVLLGICGGIAAYKIALLIRLLKKSGAEVKCIMTPASCDFISPLTISTLSENPVGIQFWNKHDGTWFNHVEYGIWADVFVIAPLTANSLSKLATGAADNLLMAAYLSMKAPVMVAPAMDLDMYRHETTLRNIETIKKDGVVIIPAESGELASGLVGEGRMAEPETIVTWIEEHFTQSQEWSGRKVLITAGPTYESIDPVRFIGNHSSGKMGFALAESLLNAGAEVILVTGPSKLSLEHNALSLIRVQSANEMLETVQTYWGKMDAGIFSAAVSDYRPKNPAIKKIKKKEDTMTIELVKNPDILAWAGTVKQEHQRLVGFALETNDARINAADKLAKKNLDFIVINTLEDEGAGFGYDTNKVAILDNHNNFTSFELKSKKSVANDIIVYLNSHWK
jgi:phosphopantothenoylcysteine decarboxylase/phosphopantothenate--cysteine ligase